MSIINYLYIKMAYKSSLAYDLIKIRLFIFIFQILYLINFTICGSCSNIYSLTTTSCFNDVIIFSDGNWRAGHVATNKNKVTIAEFSLNDEESKSRIFYGLKENGRHYFTNGFKKIDDMQCQDCGSSNLKGRFEARNLFMSLNSDTQKKKQYLFSMSSYKSLVELLDVDDGDNITYYAWNTVNFLGLTRPIFSLEYSLFEIGNNNIYITAFIESAGTKPDSNGVQKEYSEKTSLKKFKLDNFSSDNYRTLIKSATIDSTYNGRCTSAFRFDDAGRIVLLYVEPKTNENNGHNGKYLAKLYDDDLGEKGSYSIYDNVQNLWDGYGIFIKGISIKGNNAAIAFYHNGNDDKSLIFKFIIYESDNGYTVKHNYDFNSYHFNQDVDSNGLYKLDDDRIVLLTTEVIYKDGNAGNTADNNKEKYTYLHMFLFDFFNNYQGYKLREYKFNYPNKRFAKEIAAYTYNGYILLCVTLSDSSISSTFASMIIFGFGNGTDHTINISPYLMDTDNYSSSNNLFTYLMSKMVIDNNIFDYEKVQKIRLVNICDELKLYRGTLNIDKEDETLPLNELFDANHTLLQNKEIKKEEDKLYTLEYQYMVKEKDYDTFFGTAILNKAVGLEDNTIKNNYYKPKILNGRTNILSFKLCHKYCIECLEYGRTDNDQRCENCKEIYTYDYLASVNNFTKNCVPENYMYDAESKELKLCSGIYKYYYNRTRSNKKYCFKYMYECPAAYHYLNETNNECIDYFPPTTIPNIIPTTIPTTIPTKIPTTIPTKIPTTIPTKIPTTIPTKIMTTIPTKILTTILVPIPTTTIIEPILTTIIKPKITTIIEPIPTTIIKPIPTTFIKPIPTTIIEPKITTIIEPIPTTIIKPIPTTIIEPIRTTTIEPIPTTIIKLIPTTIIKPIVLTVPKQIPTNAPKIETTILVIPPTTIPKILPTPTPIINEQCKYGVAINYTSSFSNLSNDEIYQLTREKIISSYCLNGSSVTIEASNGFAFQVSNTLNELKSAENENEFNSIDMTQCENILKEKYEIDPNLSLIILKFMKTGGNNEDQTFQYEVYHPTTFEKLNMSYCENTTVDVYVPFEMNEELEEVYNNLLVQGYDPLDLNDKFYREICTPYTSENGTDVLLDDREEFIYSSLVNASLCPEGCDYNEYDLGKKYIKCECGTNNTDIVTLDLEHLSGDNAYESFLSTMKSTNYKVMRCYNLVFNFKIFCHNYGSIITLIIFGVYLGFMLYYCIKDISPIKLNISKILFEEQNKENIRYSNFSKNNGKKPKGKVTFKEKSDISKNVDYPPKKGKVRKTKNNHLNNLVTENIEFIETPLDAKSNKTTKTKKTTKTTKTRPKKNVKGEVAPSTQNLIRNETKSEATRIIRRKNIDVVKDVKAKEDIDSKKDKVLDNFELNNLEFIEACELDKRSICATYWSVLMREHLALVTFFARNDYNIFYVKIENFFILFCTDMTMNGLFFVHESMHKKYTNGEDFTFVQKIPQLLFTLIVSHALEVLLCFLCMTDIHVYEIKSIHKDRNSGEKIIKILEKIKRKLIAFFIITFLFFLFYWYFISAFCAVYQNTQKIFIRDSLISFATSLIDPFIIYGITVILRFISLTLCCRKNCCGGFLYKLSDIIPIF